MESPQAVSQLPDSESSDKAWPPSSRRFRSRPRYASPGRAHRRATSSSPRRRTSGFRGRRARPRSRLSATHSRAVISRRALFLQRTRSSTSAAPSFRYPAPAADLRVATVDDEYLVTAPALQRAVRETATPSRSCAFLQIGTSGPRRAGVAGRDGEVGRDRLERARAGARGRGRIRTVPALRGPGQGRDFTPSNHPRFFVVQLYQADRQAAAPRQGRLRALVAPDAPSPAPAPPRSPRLDRRRSLFPLPLPFHEEPPARSLGCRGENRAKPSVA